ncbi:hypothetical protein JOB18_007425, partial [Solea senegalensis]
ETVELIGPDVSSSSQAFFSVSSENCPRLISTPSSSPGSQMVIKGSCGMSRAGV